MNWLSEPEIARQVPGFWPAIGLALGFPLVMVVLGEAIAACERRGIALARSLRTVRSLLVPAAALLAFVAVVLGLPADGLVVRLAETWFWIAALFTLTRLLNDLFFGRATVGSWQERVPTLFRDLVRFGLVAIGGLVIYSKVWGQDVGGALTALGVGSVVIGLALQEPLGNLVSGLMLLFERPLAVGDWVTAGGVTGKVIGINWRSVHIETPTRELHVVPNVSLYKSEFSNLSRPTPVRTEVVELGLSYDDPPDRVKRIVLDMLADTPGVLTDPPPLVRTVNYADFSVIYRVIFSVAAQDDVPAIRDLVMTRIWYTVRRTGLTIPFPIQMEYAPGESPGKPAPNAADLVAEQPRYRAAVAAAASRPAEVLEYAAGETVHSSRRRFSGFGLVVGGHAELWTRDAAGQRVRIGTLGPGDCLGDQLAVGSARDDIEVVADAELRVVSLDPAAVGDLLDRSPALAAEIGDALETRRQAARTARTARAQPTPAS